MIDYEELNWARQDAGEVSDEEEAEAMRLARLAYIPLQYRATVAEDLTNFMGEG